ncbi:MAG: hypothetical protein K6C05_02250, partial [Anaerovibrio sp.]|uniref:hypothetical protein n=1 Tax=Anaerovibrio sp. TaxID=1872532 RepID=UPI0025EE9582
NELSGKLPLISPLNILTSPSITLAARRDTVDFINDQQLDALDGEVSMFPGDEFLYLPIRCLYWKSIPLSNSRLNALVNIS